MNRTAAVVAAAAMFAFSQTARAENQRFAIAGVGAESCGEWIEGRAFHDKHVDDILATWIQGYLSGMNMQRFANTKQRMTELPDAPTILAYVDKSCRDKPLENVYIASARLYRDIQKH